MAAASTRSDVDRQRRIDQTRGYNLGLLAPRVRSVAAAQRATLERQEGAAPALRASLLDLAACAEVVAASLEAPGPSAGR